MWGHEDLLENDYEMIQDFMIWAFGKDFDSLAAQDVPDTWNKLNGHLWTCSQMGTPREDLKIMINLWRNIRE